MRFEELIKITDVEEDLPFDMMLVSKLPFRNIMDIALSERVITCFNFYSK